MVEEDHSDDDTREFVQEILKEAMPSARAGAVTCDCLFGLIDKIKKQQQQGNVTIATPPITSPPTKSTQKRTQHTRNKKINRPLLSQTTPQTRRRKRRSKRLYRKQDPNQKHDHHQKQKQPTT